MSTEKYCTLHDYEPPENSGFALCPQCELASSVGSACPICGNPGCLGNECCPEWDEETPGRVRTCNKCKHCGRKGNYIRCDHPDVKGMEEADGIAEDFAEECETYEPL